MGMKLTVTAAHLEEHEVAAKLSPVALVVRVARVGELELGLVAVHGLSTLHHGVDGRHQRLGYLGGDGLGGLDGGGCWHEALRQVDAEEQGGSGDQDGGPVVHCCRWC